jgi:hypothetical protein
MLTIYSSTVVARFRPQNKLEIASGGEPIVQFATEETCSLQVRLRASPTWLSVILQFLLLEEHYMRRGQNMCCIANINLSGHSPKMPRAPLPSIVSLT